MDILITGGCGFIGSNFIRHIIRARDDVKVFNLDKLTYAGNLANLSDVEEDYPGRYRLLKGDIGDRAFVDNVFKTFGFDAVVNFAAESHVDRSILGPEVFIQTNILGTFYLLEAARASWCTTGRGECGERRFLHISTDEVYGSLGRSGLFTEKTPYDPSSPYSASKASSDHMVNAYFRTFGLPTLITHSSNNYGPYQFPEKLIPLMINNAAKGMELPLYGDGENIRDWIHVDDHCRALLMVLEKGIPGESYNIGGQCEKTNRAVIHQICDSLDERLGLLKDLPRRDLIRFVPDRPGHDRRYALDVAKIRRELGWSAEIPFDQGIRGTIDWYLGHPQWVEDILDGSYMEYYASQYGERLNAR